MDCPQNSATVGCTQISILGFRKLFCRTTTWFFFLFWKCNFALSFLLQHIFLGYEKGILIMGQILQKDSKCKLISHHMHTVDRKIPTCTSTLILTLAIDPQSSTSFYAIKAKFVFQLGAKSEPVQVLILAQLSHGCIWIVKLEFFFQTFIW